MQFQGSSHQKSFVVCIYIYMSIYIYICVCVSRKDATRFFQCFLCSLLIKTSLLCTEA